MRKVRVGRAESEVLRYIADRNPVSVREVADHFAEVKGQSKTTILNVMERLREKGFLTRESVEGVYRYAPSQPKARLMRDLVRDFVDDMLGGSLEPLTAYLTQRATVSDGELARLKQIVADLEAARHVPEAEEAEDEPE